MVRGAGPVLVILEPEFNEDAPAGETPVREWPGFAEDLRAGAALLREQAPQVLVGTCPGDFEGPPDLERVLGPVAQDLDFLAFQEMRARSAPKSDLAEPGYLEMGRSAVSFARYLDRAFGRPILLGYVAVSSYGGWDREQARMLAALHRRRAALREAGVFGLVYFQLRDDPGHRGYFGRGERHFGLLDARGRPKPALEAFRRFFD